MSRQARVEDPSRRANRRFENKRGSKTRVGEQTVGLRAGCHVVAALAEQIFDLRTSEGWKPEAESKSLICERGPEMRCA